MRTKREIAISNKRRGKSFERRIVKECTIEGFCKAHRTWGSQGTAEGLPPEVDVVLTMQNKERLYIQCKLTKDFPKFIQGALTENIDILLVGSPNKEPLAIVRWEFLKATLFPLHNDPPTTKAYIEGEDI